MQQTAGRAGPKPGARRTPPSGSGRVKAVREEFHGDCGFGGGGEKFREGIAESDGDNACGRSRCWPNGPEAGAEEYPGQFGFGCGEGVKEAPWPNIRAVEESSLWFRRMARQALSNWA
jgi:hypothetical protein